MVCKLCPYKRHCHDKGACETCDFGKAFENYNKKIKSLKANNAQLQTEVEQLKINLEQCENGYRQQMHLLQCKLTNAKSEIGEIFDEIINALKYTRFASPIEKNGTLDYIYALKKKHTGADNESKVKNDI